MRVMLLLRWGPLLVVLLLLLLLVMLLLLLLLLLLLMLLLLLLLLLLLVLLVVVGEVRVVVGIGGEGLGHLHVVGETAHAVEVRGARGQRRLAHPAVRLEIGRGRVHLRLGLDPVRRRRRGRGQRLLALPAVRRGVGRRHGRPDPFLHLARRPAAAQLVHLAVGRGSAGVVLVRAVPAARGSGRLPQHLLLGALEALLAPQVAPVLEHVARVRVQRPVAAFARPVRGSRDLDEAVVEGERVADGVLPALLVLAVEGEEVHDELVDLAERAHLVGRLLDGHGDEGDVGVGRLGVRVGAAVRLVVAHAVHGHHVHLGAADAVHAGRRRHAAHAAHAGHAVHGAHGVNGGRAHPAHAAGNAHAAHAPHAHPAHAHAHARRRHGTVHGHAGHGHPLGAVAHRGHGPDAPVAHGARN